MTREQNTVSSEVVGVRHAPDTGYCAICGKRRVSLHSFFGVTQDTGEPICFDCWARGYRLSGQQKVPSPPPVQVEQPGIERKQAGPRHEETKTNGPKGRCDRCQAPLPRSIAKRNFGPHYCVACQETLASQSESLPASAITATQARAMEAAFLQHINDGVNRITAWPGQKPLPKRRVRKEAQHSLPPLPENYLEGHPLQDALRKRLEETPTRAYQRWNVRFGGRWPWQRNRQDLSVIAATWVSTKQALEQGSIADPGAKHALMNLEALRNDDTGTPSLLLAFSPTGWDPNMVPPANTVLVSRDVDGQWTARKGPMATGMRTIARQIVTPPMEHSEVERCVAHIEALPPARFPVSAREMAQEDGIALDTVVESMRAFAKANPSFLVCEDDLREDFLLEMRG